VPDARKVTIPVGDARRVSGLLRLPPRARACYVLAHGAGAGMTHPSLEAVSAGLAERGIATLRFQFPYMEAGGKRPDPPALAQATVRAAVAEAAELAPKLPLVAGGRSFGGRMTSQAQAAAPLDGVRGLAFLAFPLHAAGRPSTDRAAHLSDVKVPMLFLQGTRDALAERDQLRPVIARLGKRATLELFDDADHSFHVPARTGRKDADVRREMLDALAAWIDRIV
jgi:predicted alpha/beta-hydrolase family hydrolase